MSSTRRDFLKTSLGAATLVSLGPGLQETTVGAAPLRQTGDTVLIVVQLAGGNDGLNTVVPYGDDVYGRSRSTLRLTAQEVLKIDNGLGFHPRLDGLRRLYQAGQLSVVQGVGYANPHGGHEESMRYWQSARPYENACQTGWLGRTVDALVTADEPQWPAFFVGEIAPPFALNGQHTFVPTLRALENPPLVAPAGSKDPDQHRRRLAAAADVPRRDGNPLADFVQRSTAAAYAGSRKIAAVLSAAPAQPAGDYPEIPFARMLRTIAQLIRADLGIRIFYTELGGQEPGGFDNHANQRDNHAALLGQLSQSLTALVAELQRDRLLDRVLLMTFSEFGRTLQENGRRGTDHGSAQPLFLVGGKLKGGLVGAHPSLTELENGGPKSHTDFRRVYATVLDRWLGVDSQQVLGARYEPLDVLA